MLANLNQRPFLAALFCTDGAHSGFSGWLDCLQPRDFGNCSLMPTEFPRMLNKKIMQPPHML